jgi:SAM-dependent methyltransferase
MEAKLDYTEPDVWWDEYRSHYENRTWRDCSGVLADVVTHGDGGPLLDVGCGFGFLVECARRWGIEAIGLEASEKALAASHQRHPKADVRRWHGGERLPIEDGSIGVAVANEFIDHISPEQNRLLFRELNRVLRPDGTLVVRSPSRFNRFDQDKGHITFFSPSEFRRFVEEFRFSIVEQPFSPQPVLGPSRVGQVAVRMLARVTGKPEWLAARIDLVARKRDRVES